MKRYLLVTLLFCACTSHAMNWVKDGAFSEEAIQALSLLGITLPKDLVKANDILQKKYLTDYKKIDEGVSVLDLEGNEISQEKLEEFLNFTEKFMANTVINKDIISNDTVFIVPTATVNEDINIHLFSFLEKHIKSVSGVILFTAHEKNADDVTKLFKKTFPDFKNFNCVVATDQKNIVGTCCEKLQDQWKECGAPSYAVLTHWKPWDGIIKNTLKGDYKGTELQELSWKQNQSIYKDKNGNNPQGLKKLRNLTVTVYEHVKNLKIKI